MFQIYPFLREIMDERGVIFSNRLVALGCSFAGGWHIFSDSPGSFYFFLCSLQRGCHGLLPSMVLSSL